ncbi:MAG: MoaD family protein [Acidobacteria bacterium]|nr:MoaD family protein [Acidobacteriota bacterium]
MTARAERFVTVHVPAPLRDCCGGTTTLAISAGSVRGVLDELERRHPRLHWNVCDETGALRRHLNVFVNGANIRDACGLETALAPGDTVTILTAVSGG